MTLSGKHYDFKLDTGAEVNVLPLKIVRELGETHRISETPIRITAHGGFKLKPAGPIILKCSVRKVSSDLEFLVVAQEVTPILSLQACVKFGLIKRTEVNSQLKTTKN